MNPRLRFLFWRMLLILSLTGISVISCHPKQKKLDSLFTPLARKGYFNGCVLIAENGKPIYYKAFEYVNFETKQQVNNETMFEWASVSKQFTAMAIMQLHRQGKLDYKDAVVKFLPQLPYKTGTINNLLHHTSGIREFLPWTHGDRCTQMGV